MKISKSLLSIVLAVLMLGSVFIVAPISSSATTAHTQAEVVAWIKARANEGWWQDVDGAYGCQCVDLIKAYYQYFGFDTTRGNAWEYKSGHLPAGSNWSYSGTPIPGSVFVKDKDATWTMGHVGLVYAVEGSTIYTVETNVASPYDGGYPYAKATYKSHPKSYAVTFINPTFNAPHTHNYNILSGYESSHPHYAIYKCSCGATQVNKNQTQNLADCSTCRSAIGVKNLGYWFYATITRTSDGMAFTEKENNIALYTNQKNQNQIWRFTRQPDNSYMIYNVATGNHIDLDNANATNGTNIHAFKKNDTNAQKWFIVSRNNGYNLLSKCNINFAIDSLNNGSAEGTNLQLYQAHNHVAQIFSINIVDSLDYKLNGGSFYTDVIKEIKIDGINTARDTGQIVAYTSGFGSETNTNIYGSEYSFDSNGKFVSSRGYGEEKRLEILKGGFVVSGHSASKLDEFIKDYKYAYVNYEYNAIVCFKNENDLKKGLRNFISIGEKYGELPKPSREGYIFDGWYEEQEGIKKLSAESVYNGKQSIYAKWSQPNNDVEATNPSSDSQPTEPTDPTEPTESQPPTEKFTVPTETQPSKTCISNWTANGIENKTYTGKVIKQDNIIVSKDGEFADFNVKYKNNLNVGTATVTITGTGDYTGTIVKTFKITKAENPIAVKLTTKTLKLAAVKKTQTVKAITVSRAKGKVTYKLTSIPKTLKKTTKIDSKGVITIKKWKSAKKGAYKIKVKISAKGNTNYKSKSINKTVKIKVK